MLKCIELQQPTKLTIIRDNKKIAEVSVPAGFGYIDTDGFKHIETTTDPIDRCINIRIEV